MCMPFSFICLGACFIYFLFFIDLKKFGNLLTTIGIFILMIGFFVGELYFKTCSINILNVVGVAIIFIGVICIKGHLNWVRVVVLPSICSIIYYVLNIVDIDMNMFFNFLPACLVICFVSVACINRVKDGVLMTILSAIFLDILNYFIVLEDVGYLALFSREFIVCIVLCEGFILFTYTCCKLVKIIRQKLILKKQS